MSTKVCSGGAGKPFGLYVNYSLWRQSRKTLRFTCQLQSVAAEPANSSVCVATEQTLRFICQLGSVVAEENLKFICQLECCGRAKF